IADREGQDAAIAFLNEKLRLCDYLSTSPLLQVLLELGNFYGESGMKEKAAAYYEQIGHSEPVDRSDEGGQESEIRGMAANNLRIVTGSGPTARTSGSGCMLIVTLLSMVVVAAWATFTSP